MSKGATPVTTITLRSSIAPYPAALALALLLLAGPGRAEDEEDGPGGPGSESPTAFERTPPRLSLVDGEVSFWRPGAEDWAPALVNLAVAPGDTFWAGEDSNLEIQIGGHAFVRAGEETELSLMTQEPDYLQFRVSSGTASLDLRRLPAGHTVELATPDGAFLIERTGYYRVDVEDDATKLTARRGGIATLTPAQGPALEVTPSEQVVVAGRTDAPQVETYAAPELDAWDTWNYRRTDRLLEALSARYVNDDVYGLSDLDHHGSWRRVETYGPVWIPHAVPVGWAPYTYGRWLYDPFYGWTWVDDAAWGWAPFHYGRWVRVRSYWAWAPGPVVVRSSYAPALVAFFGTPRLSIGISFGAPSVAWVALGWGEPCVPWWGPTHWRARPRWIGWGGPRVVNNVVIRHETVIHTREIRAYEHTRVPGAFHAVGGKEFGRRHVREARVDARPDRFERIDGELPVKATPASFVPDGKGRRPPERVLERRVVATRAERAARTEAAERRPGKASTGRKPARDDRAPEPVLVRPPARRERQDEAVPRPPFGSRAGEERPAPTAPPRFEAKRGAEKAPERSARDVRAQDSLAREVRAHQDPPAPEARPERPERATSRAERREPAPRTEARPPEPRRAEAPERELRRGSSPSGSPPRAEPREAPDPSPANARGRSERAERSPEPAESRSSAEPAELPGEPANRVFRGRQERPAGGDVSQPRPERSESPGRTRTSASSRDEARSTVRTGKKVERGGGDRRRP
jgi:hypothetical protein